LPAGCCDHPTSRSADGRTIYLYHFGKPGSPVALLGLRTRVRAARIVGQGNPGRVLTHRMLGGAPWANIPGTLWIDLPPDACDPVCTVLALDLDGPLDLCLGEGHVITTSA
jgi:alpha-L-fucosidase